AEDGIRDFHVTGVQTCALPIYSDASTVTWVVTGPLLAFAVVGPAMGKLGDLYGHRRLYTWSMAFVSVFALLTAAAWTAGALIARSEERRVGKEARRRCAE